MEAEEGISELRNKEGQKNSFVLLEMENENEQDFLLKREVKYAKFSRNLSRYI